MTGTVILGWALACVGKGVVLRLKTMWELMRLFMVRQRFVLFPLVLCLLFLAVLLVGTELLPVFSPFLYIAF